MTAVALSCTGPQVAPAATRFTLRLAPVARNAGASARLPRDTDLSAFAGKRVLCMLDVDNLSISMARLALRVSYRDLLQRLRDQAAAVEPWAILTAGQSDGWRGERFERQGWQPLVIPRETVVTYQGPCVKANADMDLCFQAGFVIRASDADVVLLGSGDGDLCVALARGLRRVSTAPRALFTLSVPQATSHRLWSRTDLFDGNIQIGADLALLKS